MKQAPSTLLPSILELINDGKLSLAKKLLENVALQTFWVCVRKM